MTTLESGGCANCGRAIAGTDQKFCPACGQPTPVHRIDWHFLGHELEHSVLHMDRGILFSLKDLMLRPGHLMRDYIEGRRGNQVKPLLLLMIMAAMVVFLSKYLLRGDVVGSAMQAGYSGATRAQANGGFDVAPLLDMFAVVKDWINAHFAVFTLFLLPFEAGTFWLAFKGRGLNYPEWLVVTTFLTVQTFIFWLLAILLQRWIPQAQTWSMLLAVMYAIFSLAQLFPSHSRGTSVLRGIVGLGMFLLIQGALTMVVTIVVYAVSNHG
jgi:hypothetical protein